MLGVRGFNSQVFCIFHANGILLKTPIPEIKAKKGSVTYQK